MKAIIKYTSSYLPENIVTNNDLEKILDTNNEWIVARTGIEERRISKDESASDMAIKAVNTIIKKGANIKDVDAIIVATSTKEYSFPSTAGIIQANFGVKKDCLAFDLSAACSGLIFALNTGVSLIESGEAKKVLTIATEKCSDILNWADRGTAILFGDGVSACLLEYSSDEHNGIIATDSGSDINSDILAVVGGGSVNPVNEENVETKLNTIKMEGTEVFKNAVKRFNETITNTLKKASLSVDNINLIITHQANTRIMKSVAKDLNIPMDKFYINIQKYGNTSAASVGIALNEAIEKGVIKTGDTVLLTAFGAGLTWGSVLVRF